jgi:hypothetical protein
VCAYTHRRVRPALGNSFFAYFFFAEKGAMEQGTQTHTHRHRNQHGYELARTHPPRTHVLLPARAHSARRLAISLLRVCVWFQCGVYQIESAHETDRASE